MENMTHYMELLGANQPWNLLLFMVVPVLCAETLAISELYLLDTRNFHGAAARLSRCTGIFGGAYMAAVTVYLTVTSAVPLTLSGGWRGPADVIAVGFYLLSALPFAGIFLLETGLLARGRGEREKQKVHAVLIAVYLVAAHIAMVFGMLNTNLFRAAADMGGMAGM
jgi:hypothetical protein